LRLAVLDMVQNSGRLLRNIDSVLEGIQKTKSGVKHVSVALYASFSTFQMEGSKSDFHQPSTLAWISQYDKCFCSLGFLNMQSMTYRVMSPSYRKLEFPLKNRRLFSRIG